MCSLCAIQPNYHHFSNRMVGLAFPLHWIHYIGSTTYSNTLVFPRSVQASGTLIVWALFCLPVTVVCTCFDKNIVWVHYNTSASDSRVLLTFPGALNRLTLAVTLPFCFAKNASWCLLQALHLINSLKKICVGAFHIIESTKIAKIEFTSLDWIYRSIRLYYTLHGGC